VRPTVGILSADDGGVPLLAACPCGWIWTRPEDDEGADTLAAAIRSHRCPEAEP
jgi:hypothetical protein